MDGKKNSIMLYLRPMDAIQPYVVNACARWLVSQGSFPEYHIARAWLSYLEQYHPFRYKSIISAFFEQRDFKQQVLGVNSDVIRYRTSNYSNYGDEDFMYWHQRI